MRAAIRALNERLDGITLLAGIECDIRPTARWTSPTTASPSSTRRRLGPLGLNQEAAQMTDRLLRAIECPWVDVLGHPTGRLILKREPVAADWSRVIDAAAAPASRSRSTARSIAWTCRVARAPGDAQAAR